MRAVKRFFGWLLVLCLIGGAGAGYWFYGDFQRFADAPLDLHGSEQVIDVAPGTSFARIVGTLRARKLTRAPWRYWQALGWRMGVAESLHAGEYAVPNGTTPRELLLRMARGDVVQHRFTVVEGWSFRELREALARETLLEQTLAARSDADIMAALDAPGTHPEGRFLPETYAYVKGDCDFDVLKRAHRALHDALAAAWAARAADVPLKSAEELLVLASIVEKETGRADERPRIAGVFARRLRLGMKLQTDPTVIYGIGPAYAGNITRKHLETDTPYNTYTRFGLPPTPIALAGKAALMASAKPAPGDELYFVARGDGSHEFSASLREHNAAVAKYQLRR
jgi:UPF0755 protein